MNRVAIFVSSALLTLGSFGIGATVGAHINSGRAPNAAELFLLNQAQTANPGSACWTEWHGASFGYEILCDGAK